MKWKNWSGNVECNPKSIKYPSSEEEVIKIVKEAKSNGQKIRVVGSGHSFTAVVATDQVLLSLDKMQGLIGVDKNLDQAEVWAGTKLKALGDILFDNGLAQENMGDINVQSIAGALSTGTHGTGASLGTLSTQIVEVTFVNGNGELKTVSAKDGDLFDAARISLGLLGVITRMKLQLVKAYKLEEEVRKESLSDCLKNIHKYRTENRNFEFFWFPYTQTVQTKFLNITEKPQKVNGAVKKKMDVFLEKGVFGVLCKLSQWIPSFSKQVAKISAKAIGANHEIDWSHNIYATVRGVKFNEMEYNVPLEHFEAVFLELKDMIESNKLPIQFPLECRFVKADEMLISPAYQREAAYIAVHAYNGKEYDTYFKKAEAIFNKYNGRPHWGKLNYKGRDEFKKIYPKWDVFNQIRSQEDPDRIFVNSYLDEIF
jgi:FAD-linked oxidoreductase